MKILITVLILGLCKGIQSAYECDTDVPVIDDPHCGVLPDCYQEGFNSVAIEAYSCVLKHRGMPDFTSVIKGDCPTDKPACPTL